MAGELRGIILPMATPSDAAGALDAAASRARCGGAMRPDAKAVGDLGAAALPARAAAA